MYQPSSGKVSETFLYASGKCMVSFTVNDDTDGTAEAYSLATGRILVVSVLRAPTEPVLLPGHA